MVNCYLSTLEQGPRQGKLRVRGIPGMKNFTLLPDSPMRGLLQIDGGNRLFAVAGSTVYEILNDGTPVAQTGNIALNSHPVTMVTNGFQIAIASAGLLFMLNGVGPGAPGVVTPVNFTDGTPVQAATVDFLDQYFIINKVDTKQVFISNLAPDGATWDQGNTALKEGYPDNIARVLADNEQLWLFGTDTTEVWQDTGALFPFERIQGAVLKVGTSAPYSVAAARGYRCWLWNNVVYGAYGIDPQRISDYGVEVALASYGDTSDAEGWMQIAGGHTFYVLNLPRARRCWVYDITQKCWHERGLWQAGQFGVYRGRVYARAFNKELVGDPVTGQIYELDYATFTDAMGAPLRRLRTADYLVEDMHNVRYNQLTLDMDTGVGLDVAPSDPGYDPQLVMRYSDNRGKTWSNELQASMGRVGQDDIRVIFNQLGASRIGKTFEVVVTDPVYFGVNTAQLKLGHWEEGR